MILCTTLPLRQGALLLAPLQVIYLELLKAAQRKMINYDIYRLFTTFHFTIVVSLVAMM